MVVPDSSNARLSAPSATRTPPTQHGVDLGIDPVLEVSGQHQHTGLPPFDGQADLTGFRLITAKPDKVPRQDSTHHATDRKDLEKGAEGGPDNTEVENQGVMVGQQEVDPQQHTFARFFIKWKAIFHFFFWLLFTGWWIAGLVLHRYDLGWVVPFLFWLGITVRLLTFYVPISVVTTPMHLLWTHTGVRFAAIVPQKLRIPLSATAVIAIFLVGSFASPESQDNNRANRAVSLFGLVVFVGVLWLTSRSRKKIMWHTVIVGLLVQFLTALFDLRTQVGYDIFKFVSSLCTGLLGFADQGTSFLTDKSVPDLHWFLTGVIPAIIFFVAFVQLLYYWGWLQWIIRKFAVFFFWSMKVSGAEAVVAAASPFIGQGESAMLIKPFVAHLTQAELHQIMCSGFATIAGSVLVAYISLGVNAQALVSSCVMSIPASLAISKLRYPEEEETMTAGRVIIPDDGEDRAANSLHAFAKGTWLGLKIAGMILATLLCIIALLGLVNGLLTWWGHYLNINNPPLTVQLIVGYLCYPIAFLLGVPRNGDIFLVAQLIGTKLIAVCFP